MQDLKLTTTEGIEMNLNPFCIGVWYAGQGQSTTMIEVNGVTRAFRVNIKEADKAIRGALAPE